MSAATPFAFLKQLSSRTKQVTIAIPEDIEDSVPQWSDSQKKVREELRGDPLHGYKLQLKPGADSYDFTIRRLTAAQQKVCDDLVSNIVPPRKTELKTVRHGEPPVEVPSGWDEEDPEYLKKMAAARDNQTILYVIFGVDGLDQEIDGTIDEKIEKIRESLDQRLILMLANEVASWSYSAGDPADFFTKANSTADTTHG